MSIDDAHLLARATSERLADLIEDVADDRAVIVAGRFLPRHPREVGPPRRRRPSSTPRPCRSPAAEVVEALPNCGDPGRRADRRSRRRLGEDGHRRARPARAQRRPGDALTDIATCSALAARGLVAQPDQQRRRAWSACSPVRPGSTALPRQARRPRLHRSHRRGRRTAAAPDRRDDRPAQRGVVPLDRHRTGRRHAARPRARRARPAHRGGRVAPRRRSPRTGSRGDDRPCPESVTDTVESRTLLALLARLGTTDRRRAVAAAPALDGVVAASVVSTWPAATSTGRWSWWSTPTRRCSGGSRPARPSPGRRRAASTRRARPHRRRSRPRCRRGAHLRRGPVRARRSGGS